MTEERNPAAPGPETDDRVTQAYRELATERTPAHLDEAVLGRARSAARPEYSRLRMWTRPLAWAATVMLTVAIVLQIGDVPGPEGIVYDETAPAMHEEVSETDAREPEAAEDAGTDRPSAAKDSESPATIPTRSAGTATDVRKDAAAGRAAANPAISEPAPEKRQRAKLVEEPKLEQQTAAPEAPVDGFTPRDADMLQRAADMARTQSGENRNTAAEESAAGALGLSSIEFRDEPRLCDETATRTPEAWLECITELEKAGFVDAAVLERERLREVFPDFEAP